MKLVLYINEKQIDCLPVQAEELGNPQYIEGLKEKLENKNRKTIEASPDLPQYFIEGVPSRMNK